MSIGGCVRACVCLVHACLCDSDRCLRVGLFKKKIQY